MWTQVALIVMAVTGVSAASDILERLDQENPDQDLIDELKVLIRRLGLLDPSEVEYFSLQNIYQKAVERGNYLFPSYVPVLLTSQVMPTGAIPKDWYNLGDTHLIGNDPYRAERGIEYLVVMNRWRRDGGGNQTGLIAVVPRQVGRPSHDEELLARLPSNIGDLSRLRLKLIEDPVQSAALEFMNTFGVGQQRRVDVWFPEAGEALRELSSHVQDAVSDVIDDGGSTWSDPAETMLRLMDDPEVWQDRPTTEGVVEWVVDEYDDDVLHDPKTASELALRLHHQQRGK